MEDLTLHELDINETEQRLIYSQYGIRLPRGMLKDQLIEAFDSGILTETAQDKIRSQTQQFVVKNWEFLKGIAEVYGCTGNCAGAQNRCTDVRAVACFKECFPTKRRR